MKYYLLIATAFVALASCSDEFAGNEKEPVNEAAETAITFGSSTQAVTRSDYTGSAAAGMLNNNFVVYGIKWNGGTSTQEKVFDHYNVNWATNTAYTTTSNTNDWEYVGQTKHAYATAIAAQTVKYWDYAKSQYDLIAYSKGLADAVYADADYNAGTKVQISAIDPSKMNGVDTNSDGIIDQGAYSIKGKADNLAKCYIADLKTVYRDGTTANDAAGDYNKVVQFKFRSLSAKVRIAIYETVPGYSVKDVVFYTDASTLATDGKAHLYTEGTTNNFNEEGTYVVYYPTTGKSKVDASDYNKAHLDFIPATSGTKKVKDFGEVDPATQVVRETAETASTTDHPYLGRSSNAATYYGPTTSGANHYTVVIPNESGAVMNLKVNYTLLSTDGSNEIINVYGASATVPAIYTQWKSGYAYTYIFKINENTNGKTNPNIDVAGLYPITFDAVVTENENGIQETITTISEPSITTFGYDTTTKKYVSNENEYAAGNDVYAVVMEGGNVVNVKVGSTTGNVHIYRDIVSSDPVNFPVSEASFAEAVEKTSVGTKKITFTHVCATSNDWLSAHVANVSTVPGIDGNTITTSAIQLKNLPAGTYAVRYTKTAPTVTPAVYTPVTAGDALVTDGSVQYYVVDESSDTGYKKYTIVGGENTTTTTYYTLTSAEVVTSPGKYVYKIIRVQ